LNFLQKVVKESVEIYNLERPHWSLHANTTTNSQRGKEENIQIKTYKKEKTDNLKTAWLIYNLSKNL
jgi:hypothetical protein